VSRLWQPETRNPKPKTRNSKLGTQNSPSHPFARNNSVLTAETQRRGEDFSNRADIGALHLHGAADEVSAQERFLAAGSTTRWSGRHGNRPASALAPGSPPQTIGVPAEGRQNVCIEDSLSGTIHLKPLINTDGHGLLEANSAVGIRRKIHHAVR
jgi:hypothetical protein